MLLATIGKLSCFHLVFTIDELFSRMACGVTYEVA